MSAFGLRRALAFGRPPRAKNFFLPASGPSPCDALSLSGGGLPVKTGAGPPPSLARRCGAGRCGTRCVRSPTKRGAQMVHVWQSSDLEELGQDDKEQGGDADDLGRLQVEGVDLGAQPRGEGRVVDALQPRAIHVPGITCFPGKSLWRTIVLCCVCRIARPRPAHVWLLHTNDPRKARRLRRPPGCAPFCAPAESPHAAAASSHAAEKAAAAGQEQRKASHAAAAERAAATKKRRRPPERG